MSPRFTACCRHHHCFALLSRTLSYTSIPKAFIVFRFLFKKPYNRDTKVNKIILRTKDFMFFIIEKIPPPENLPTDNQRIARIYINNFPALNRTEYEHVLQWYIAQIGV